MWRSAATELIALAGGTGVQLSMKISCGKNKGKLFKVWQKHEAVWAGQAYSALSNRCDRDLFVS